MILLPAGAVAQFVYRHSLLGVLVSVVLCGLLLCHRKEFAALPDPRSRWRALANFVLVGAGSLTLGLVVVSVHPGRVVGNPPSPTGSSTCCTVWPVSRAPSTTRE
ncbi:hypothetical protein NKH18_23130 [Streptomyces sp. M10(2022)]